MLLIRLRTEGSRAGRLKTRGLRGIGVSPAAWYEAMSTELLRRRLHGRRRGVENNPRCSQSNSARARGRVGQKWQEDDVVWLQTLLSCSQYVGLTLETISTTCLRCFLVIAINRQPAAYDGN